VGVASSHALPDIEHVEPRIGHCVQCAVHDLARRDQDIARARSFLCHADLVEGEFPAVEPAADACAHGDALLREPAVEQARHVHVRAVGEVPLQASCHTRTFSS
jgi:hypothetical protein